MVFNPAKDTQVTNISQWEADYNHMMQTLTGDQTDGYAGCPNHWTQNCTKNFGQM